MANSDKNSRIQSYRDLRVWQDGMTLATACYQLTRRFPKEELFGLTTQIRRAASSVPANIAEGHGRENRGEFIQFLRIAQGSLKEVETHILLSVRVGLMMTQPRKPYSASARFRGNNFAHSFAHYKRSENVANLNPHSLFTTRYSPVAA